MSSTTKDQLKRKIAERDSLNKSLSERIRKHKPGPDFYDKTFLGQLSDIFAERTEHEICVGEVERLGYELNGLVGQYDGSDDAEDHKVRLHTLHRQKEILEDHLENFRSEEQEQQIRSRAFLQLYATSNLGLNQNIHMPARKGEFGSEQSKFKKDAIELYNSRHEDPTIDEYWCPITQNWFQFTSMTAAHIFPYASGREIMRSIFEIDKDELMNPFNCLYINTSAERIIAKGVIAIVPSKDVSTDEKLAAWRNQYPLEYKLKVIDNSSKMLLQKPPGSRTETWRDYDNKPLVFRSKFRPRSRYLFWSYTCAILQLSYRARQLLPDHAAEFGKPYWGTGGQWMNRAMLKSFAHEMGSTYAPSLGVEADDLEQDDRGLLVATNRIVPIVQHDDDDDA